MTTKVNRQWLWTAAFIALATATAIAVNGGATPTTGKKYTDGPIRDVYDDGGLVLNVNKLTFQGSINTDPTDSSKLLVKTSADYVDTATTTHGTAIPITTITIPTFSAVSVETTCTALKSDETEGASYLRQAAFRRGSTTTVTQVGSTRTIGTDNEDDADWVGPTYATASGAVTLNIDGEPAGDTIYWQCSTRRTIARSNL